MLFNSYEFLIFLPIVWLVYWVILRRWLYAQNVFVLVASYVFYGWWDWRFLLLIAASSLVDYFTALQISQTDNQKHRKYWLWVSLAANLGVLLFFKYYNFFTENLVAAFDSVGIYVNPVTLNVILPVGVSFYTFQTLSYTLDAYQNRIKPTKDIVAFFSFVAFFPQLVAGPIERARHLLPQFQKKREFDYRQSVDGLRQILWGMFKKVVVADSIAPSVDYIFGHYYEVSGGALIVGGILFSFQIYGDFSGYSDIAIGTARLFGFDLKPNFRTPFFSRGAFDLALRWHISLNSWFRDYFYKWLRGNNKTLFRQAFSTFLTFAVSGLWHGAAWNYVTWGVMYGAYFMQAFYYRTYVAPYFRVKNALIKKVSTFLLILKTFGFMTFSLIVFRTVNFRHARDYFGGMFDATIPYWQMPDAFDDKYHLPIMLTLLVFEFFNRNKKHGLQIERVPQVLRWMIYIALCMLILQYFGSEQSFIYFQF